MDNALQISSAAATIEGPLAGESGSGLLRLPDNNVFAVAAAADGSPADHFAVRIVLKALRIAFQPRDGSAPASRIEDKALLIRNALKAAGEAIASQPSEKRSGGATVAVLAFDDEDHSRACIIGVGDCRCYRFRNSRPERLTRAASAADTAAETPLFLDVLHTAIGADESADVDERFIEVLGDDSFVLMPGLLLRANKSDITVGRAMRRAPRGEAPEKIQCLIDEAVKEGSTLGGAILVCAEDVVAEQPSPPVETEIPAPMPSSAPTAGDTVVEMPLEEVEREPEIAEEPAPVAEALAKIETRKIEIAEKETVASPMPAPAPKPSPVTTPLRKFGLAPKPEPEPAIISALEAAATAAGVMAVQKPQSPLTRPSLLRTAQMPQKPVTPKLPLAAIIVVAGGLLVVALIGYGGTRLWKVHKAHQADQALEQAVRAGGLVKQTRSTGQWGALEKKIAGLTSLPSDDELSARAWIEFWHQAADPAFNDVAARQHLAMIDALAQYAGSTEPVVTPMWQSADRADAYCRLVFKKQQNLSAAVGAMLPAMNKRGDIPFERSTQEAVLTGIGQFTRGRYAQKLDGIRGSFASVRIAEGQLESWLVSDDMNRPQTAAAIQQKPGEPLRQLQTNLDRAWDSMFEIINGLGADTTYWKKQNSAASLLSRINRLEAVRQNVITDRKKYGDIHRWRVATQSKSLVNWLLSESATLGAQLGKPTPPPATTSRRR